MNANVNVSAAQTIADQNNVFAEREPPVFRRVRNDERIIRLFAQTHVVGLIESCPLQDFSYNMEIRRQCILNKTENFLSEQFYCTL